MGFKGGYFWVDEKLLAVSSKEVARAWCEIDVDDLLVVLATYGDGCGKGELNGGVHGCDEGICCRIREGNDKVGVIFRGGITGLGDYK